MIKAYTATQLGQLEDEAASAGRRRAHLNVHAGLDANVQRLFIATQPDTYMRPHRHPEAHKWEFFVVLEGKIDLLVFDDRGEMQQRIAMSSEQTRAVEVPPGTWHAYVCMKANTLALEIKEGAYLPTREQDFAAWSPAENTGLASGFVERMRVARVGDLLAP
ncbi:MAG TPA: WbuC family cupin fold metalloprotein [Gammaproteobacteria bacterium]|nr:WbuC family cupin fold metalloprotein [Gammaproteobacteria bacterium]